MFSVSTSSVPVLYTLISRTLGGRQEDKKKLQIEW